MAYRRCVLARRVLGVEESDLPPSARATGNLAGMFEYDGETGYFYIYETQREERLRVIGYVLSTRASSAFARRVSPCGGTHQASGSACSSGAPAG